MTSILRAFILSQKKLCLRDFTLLGRSITGFTYSSSNIQKCVPTLQVKYFSTEQDKESEWKLIYTGKLSNQIRNLKAFSLCSSFIALICQPFLYIKAAESDNVIGLIVIFGTVGIFALATPLLLHLIAKRYVTHVYYSSKENKYLAQVYTLFLRKRKIEFTIDDVHVPDVTGMFTCCTVKGFPVFFNETEFKDIAHYFQIMGHHKPIDFKLGNVDQINTATENPQQLKIENKQ